MGTLIPLSLRPSPGSMSTSKARPDLYFSPVGGVVIVFGGVVIVVFVFINIIIFLLSLFLLFILLLLLFLLLYYLLNFNSIIICSVLCVAYVMS